MQREDIYCDNALICREVCGENDGIFRVSRGEKWKDGTSCELARAATSCSAQLCTKGEQDLSPEKRIIRREFPWHHSERICVLVSNFFVFPPHLLVKV